MKIKCGVLPLLVETGRFKNTPREMRICQICDKHAIETEYHFLFVCPRLEDERDDMYNDYPDIPDLKDKPEHEQLTFLLQKNNVIRFGKHLEQMFEARRRHMYTVERNRGSVLNVSLSNNGENNEPNN